MAELLDESVGEIESSGCRGEGATAPAAWPGGGTACCSEEGEQELRRGINGLSGKRNSFGRVEQHGGGTAGRTSKGTDGSDRRCHRSDLLILNFAN